MKILTIAGTRPELIRLSIILKKLDNRCNHKLLWTRQNFTPELSDNFFKEFDVQQPDQRINRPEGGIGYQVAQIFELTEDAINDFAPDKALILGDTNSALSAIICERMGVPVFHMEAGNRCHDWRVPEEQNRRVIDAVSSWALPYTPGSAANLMAEGIPRARIKVCGNPIYEVIEANRSRIPTRQFDNTYFLATFHRQENVDNAERLHQIFLGLSAAARRHDAEVFCSVHPRTKQKIADFGLDMGNYSSRIRLFAPFGFADFLSLERNALGVFTDSGTVQEECCLFRIPTVTIRDSTERPETVACGSNLVSGLKATNMDACMTEMLDRETDWAFPAGYRDPAVSEKVLEILDV